MEFIQQKEIDEHLNKCLICSNTMSLPKLLICCAETICDLCEKKHFKLKQSNKCPLCSEITHLDKPLPINKSIRKLLALKRLTLQESKHTKEAKEIYFKFRQKLNDLELVFQNPQKYIHEHFSNIKQSINKFVYELIETIKEKHNKVLNDLEKHENESKEFIQSKTSLNYNQYQQILNIQLTEFKNLDQSISKSINDLNLNKQNLDDLKLKISLLDSKIDHFNQRLKNELLLNKKFDLIFFDHNSYRYFNLLTNQNFKTIEFYESLKIVRSNDEDDSELTDDSLNQEFLNLCIENNYFNLENIIKNIEEYLSSSDLGVESVREMEHFDPTNCENNLVEKFLTSLNEYSFEIDINKLLRVLKSAFHKVDILKLVFKKLFPINTEKLNFHYISSNEMTILQRLSTKDMDLSCLRTENDLKNLKILHAESKSLLNSPTEFIKSHMAKIKKNIQLKTKSKITYFLVRLLNSCELLDEYETRCSNALSVNVKEGPCFDKFKQVVDLMNIEIGGEIEGLGLINDLTDFKDKTRRLLKKIECVSFYIKNELLLNKIIKLSDDDHTVFSFESNLVAMECFESIKILDLENKEYFCAIEPSRGVSVGYVSEYFRLKLKSCLNEWNESDIENFEIFSEYARLALESGFYDKSVVDKAVIDNLYKYNLKEYKEMLKKIDFLEFLNFNLKNSDKIKLKNELNLMIYGIFNERIDCLQICNKKRKKYSQSSDSE